MYPAERQAAMLAIARNRGGTLDLGTAKSEFGVTSETVRRDFADLVESGHVTRHRGGIRLLTTAPLELALAQRRMQDTPQKLKIAKRVVSLLPERGSVFLDSGSVALFVASVVPLDRELTVITNNLPASLLLLQHPSLTLLSLPGQVKALTQGIIDPEISDVLSELTIDVAVLGCNGVTPSTGATTTSPEEALVKQAAMRAARTRVLAVTPRAVGADAMCRFASLRDIDTIVTERDAGERAIKQLAAEGPDVITA
ncbi:MAG: DeoR/GlpR family DNA-binding transcription regulator [Leucobacter sp.]